MSILYLALSVLFNVAAYLVYKGIADRPGDLRWYLMFTLGLALGGANILLFTRSLKEISLSIAYPVFSGGCITLIMLLSWAIFRERLSAGNVIGAVVVMAGIFLLTR